MTADGNRGREHRLEIGLSDSLAAPATARDSVDDWLRTRGLARERRRDVLLAVSELVTNAVTHAGSAPTLVVTMLPDCLRVEVRDASIAEPSLRLQGDSSGGFGLRLVGQVTDQWGWQPERHGKVVWAEFRLDDA